MYRAERDAHLLHHDPRHLTLAAGWKPGADVCRAKAAQDFVSERHVCLAGLRGALAHARPERRCARGRHRGVGDRAGVELEPRRLEHRQAAGAQLVRGVRARAPAQQAADGAAALGAAVELLRIRRAYHLDLSDGGRVVDRRRPEASHRCGVAPGRR